MEENSLRVLGKGVLLVLSKGKKWIELEMELRIGQSSPKERIQNQGKQSPPKVTQIIPLFLSRTEFHHCKESTYS